MWQDYSPAIAITNISLQLPNLTVENDSKSVTCETDYQLAQEMLKLDSELPSEEYIHTISKPFIPQELKWCTYLVKSSQGEVPIRGPLHLGFKSKRNE